VYDHSLALRADLYSSSLSDDDDAESESELEEEDDDEEDEGEESCRFLEDDEDGLRLLGDGDRFLEEDAALAATGERERERAGDGER
jgi:hypothetical protein